jgi:hypothetical protein
MTYIYESPDKGKTIYRREFNNYKKREKIMEMISLYNYLGHAAGPELGKRVNEAARKSGVMTKKGELPSSHRGWNEKEWGKGPTLYPKTFLDLYFKNGLNEGTNGKQLLRG